MSTGNCPETPRQKMIGMMYLFYTALLALNVSGEIINAFVLVNDSLEVTTSNFSNKTQGLYDELGSLAALQKEKYGPVFDEAMVVKQRTNEIIEDVERLKQEIIAKADGLEYNPEVEISVHEIKKKDNLNAAAEIMIGEGGPKKADSLKNWVDDYRDFMVNHVDTSSTVYKNVLQSLNTDDKLDDKDEKRTWQEKLFLGMPLVGSVALMTKLQTDIRNAEADIIENMIVGVDKTSIAITSVEALVSSNASYIVKGGTYEAQVFIGARDTSMKPTIYVSTKYPFYDTVDAKKGIYKMRGTLGVDYDSLKVEEGKGIYTLENLNSIGTQQWGGIIVWNTKQGTKYMPFMNEYMVGESGFAVSPSGVNVFYRGIDNPVEISVSGYPKEKVSASMTGGSLIPRGDGSWIAKITSPSTRQVSISVSVKTEDGGTKVLGAKPFRVLSVPVPPAKLNGTKSEGKVHKNDVLSGVLMADLGDQFFPFDVRFTVTSFRFTYKVRGQTNSITVYGNRLNAEAQSALQGLGRGTRISFESIQVQGPSGTFQTAPITLELR